jgi:hypothetical protein
MEGHEYWPLLLQTVVIVLAILASVRHSEKRITRLETKVESLEDSVERLPGISRALARVEGELHTRAEICARADCPIRNK